MRPCNAFLLSLLTLGSAVSLCRGATCPSDARPIIELRVTSDRGDAFDRTQRIEVREDGCVEVDRPPFHRAPGTFSAQIDPELLQRLQRRAADPALRAIDPQRALATARESLHARAAAEGELRRTHVSHATAYVLRLGPPEATTELRVESIFQHAELHPQSKELAALAQAIREVLALDVLPELRPGVRP